MRILSRTVALLAVSGCMSNTARHQNNSHAAAAFPKQPRVPGAQVLTPPTDAANDIDSSVVNSTHPVSLEVTPAKNAVEFAVESNHAAGPAVGAEPADDCGPLKNAIQFPFFLKEKPALVVSMNRVCKSKTGEKIDPIKINISAVGVSCTGAYGLINRRGHSTQNWELITFGMDLACNMVPADEVKTLGKKKLGIEADAHLVSYVPMLIEYWEFEKNNDAGFGAYPKLTAAGGGASQWKKNEVKNNGFPIKLYGHSSTFTRDQSMYEVSAIIKPRSNQRQFEISVQDMKLMGEAELKTTLDRCKSKTNSKAACDDAFIN